MNIRVVPSTRLEDDEQLAAQIAVIGRSHVITRFRAVDKSNDSIIRQSPRPGAKRLHSLGRREQVLTCDKRVDAR
jgi:hypothetical protein